jgi:hypothetical protein
VLTQLFANCSATHRRPIIAAKKSPQSFLLKVHSLREGEPHMRIAKVIFIGSVAALAVLMAPALAKNSEPQKTDDKSASPSCHSYQPAADGTWTELPCQEVGAPKQQQAQPKLLTRSPEQEAR